MAHRIARSLDTLRSQINAHAPRRRKASDGWIGDAAHRRAGNASDHNPWVMDGRTGVVTALDVTHDPANGVDTWAMADHLRLKRDSRIKYVISNHRIFSATVQPWTWRRYTGSHPHHTHIHVSVVSTKSLYDSTRPWDWGAGAPAETGQDAPTLNRRTLRRGMDGDDVAIVQGLLVVGIDGRFGPITEGAVRAFQRSERIEQDGVVGPITWGRLDTIQQLPTPGNYDGAHILSEPADADSA